MSPIAVRPRFKTSMGELAETKTPCRDLGILSNFMMFVYLVGEEKRPCQKRWTLPLNIHDNTLDIMSCPWLNSVYWWPFQMGERPIASSSRDRSSGTLRFSGAWSRYRHRASLQLFLEIHFKIYLRSSVHLKGPIKRPQAHHVLLRRFF